MFYVFTSISAPCICAAILRHYFAPAYPCAVSLCHHSSASSCLCLRSFASSFPCVFVSLHLRFPASSFPCVFVSLRLRFSASSFPCVFVSLRLRFRVFCFISLLSVARGEYIRASLDVSSSLWVIIYPDASVKHPRSSSSNLSSAKLQMVIDLILLRNHPVQVSAMRLSFRNLILT